MTIKVTKRQLCVRAGDNKVFPFTLSLEDEISGFGIPAQENNKDS